MALVELERDAPAAHDAIQRGRWDDADALIREVQRDTDPAAVAWSAAFRAAQALVHGQVELPVRETVAALPVDDARVAAPVRSVAHHGVIAALARFDAEELRSWAELARRCAPESEAAITGVRLAFARGDLEAALARCHELDAEDASAEQIEARCIEALCALTLGRHDEARAAARRASRASRRSELRAYRFLSGLVLARVRRSLGRGHLAGRILCAMRPILPITFHGWLRWELLLAGQSVLRDDGTGRAHDASAALSATLRAVASGDAQAFAARGGELRSAVSSVAFLAPEVEALLALLDPTVDASDAPEDIREFLRGDSAQAPLGLDAMSSGEDADGRPYAVVLRRGGQPPRRLLSIAAPLVEGATTLPLTRLKRGRVDLACAVLALAPGGLSDEGLFRACYRFAYARHLHESVLSMLLSRVRERLDGLYDVERSGGTVRLVGTAPILAPDPRCVAGLEQKLLKLVARLGAVSTRVAAKELGVSLRAVQETVARLVDDDELTMDRSGRSVGYRLEDTSFSELTTE